MKPTSVVPNWQHLQTVWPTSSHQAATLIDVCVQLLLFLEKSQREQECQKFILPIDACLTNNTILELLFDSIANWSIVSSVVKLSFNMHVWQASFGLSKKTQGEKNPQNSSSNFRHFFEKNCSFYENMLYPSKTFVVSWLGINIHNTSLHTTLPET